MNVPSRDDLIDEVKYGRLTPAEADAEAARLGLRPFAHDPDPLGFDPMKEEQWTLPMAAAWIAFRTPEVVRDWWDSYRAERLIWRPKNWRVPGGPVYEGHFLEQPPRATLALFGMLQFYEPRPDRDSNYSMEPKEAINALWDGLRSSCFEASGIDLRTGKRVTIPLEQWRDLEWFEERGRDIVRARDSSLNGGAAYRGVTVPMRLVVGLWPRPKPAQKLELPDLMRPDGGGYMPLYCAAQWIASQGGAVEFDPGDEALWRTAFDTLLAQLASEEVRAIGTRQNEPEPVPGHHFATCRVSYPFHDTPIELISSNETYLRSFAYAGEERWRDGFDDALVNHRGPRWSRLMVRKDDIARLWPFDTTPPRTGAPGRPTSMYLVEAEFARRCQDGCVEANATLESKVLAKWLHTRHPTVPQLKPKSIRLKIAPTFRAHKGAAN